jgi:ABC-type transporter Mla subunit MlaD
MSILKPRGLQRSGKPAELEGNIRELVRRQSSAVRQANNNSEEAVRELASLVNRVSGDATREVDHLIGGLSHLRQKLDDEAGRIHRDIVEFASLSQSIMQLTNIVSDGMAHVAKVAEAPGIAEDIPASDPAAMGPEEQALIES